MTKRICLFAGYHPQGHVSDYVVYYIKSLAAVADVYYWADCTMDSAELSKLAPYVKRANAKRHGKYDFGSWQALIQQIGWNTLSQYDECVFANDSVFGPLFSLGPLLEKGTRADVDAWAINAYQNQHLETYFYVLKRKIILSPICQQFFSEIASQKSFDDVVLKYEQGLTRMLKQGKFSYGVVCSARESLAAKWRRYVRMGLPFLKIKIFTRYSIYSQDEWLPGWRKFLKKYTDYPVALIEQHLNSVNLPVEQFDRGSFFWHSLVWRIRRIRQRVFRVRFYKNEKIVVLFGITLYSNLPKETTQRVKEL